MPICCGLLPWFQIHLGITIGRASHLGLGFEIRRRLGSVTWLTDPWSDRGRSVRSTMNGWLVVTGTWLLFSHILGILIPTVELIFFRRGATTNQMVEDQIFERWDGHWMSLKSRNPIGSIGSTLGFRLKGGVFHSTLGQWPGPSGDWAGLTYDISDTASKIEDSTWFNHEKQG